MAIPVRPLTNLFEPHSIYKPERMNTGMLLDGVDNRGDRRGAGCPVLCIWNTQHLSNSAFTSASALGLFQLWCQNTMASLGIVANTFGIGVTLDISSKLWGYRCRVM